MMKPPRPMQKGRNFEFFFDRFIFLCWRLLRNTIVIYKQYSSKVIHFLDKN